ncbi:hypothetical protein ACHAXR_000496, partial [Thalassiosira sp. AJA248-18]
VDWEMMSNNNNTTSSSSTTSEKIAVPVAGVDETTGGEGRSIKTGIHGNKLQASRTKTFLVGGGMKLIERWLVDSYTVVPAPSSPNQRQAAAAHSSEKCSIANRMLITTTTAFTEIYPIRQTTHCGIANKQIHKTAEESIRYMLVKGLDPNTLEGVVHPIAGGLSVGKVIAADGDIMSSWSEAAANEAATSSNDNACSVRLNPFQQLEKKIQMRFDDLAKFQHGEGDPPAWLPKSMLGLRRVVPTVNAGKSTKLPYPLYGSSPPTPQDVRP